MTDESCEQETYQRWLLKHRDAAPPSSLTDQVMASVADLESEHRVILWLSLVQRIQHLRVARWAMCSIALAIGSVPFLFLAYVAEFLKF